MLAECENKTVFDFVEEHPLAIQIAGCGRMLSQKPIYKNAVRKLLILIFGCPVKKIVNNMGGSALMRDEPLAVGSSKMQLRGRWRSCHCQDAVRMGIMTQSMLPVGRDGRKRGC